MNGSSTGSDPFARITCSAWIVVSPTVQVFPSVNVAKPLTTRTFARFSNPATPVLSFWTIVSFHLTVSPKFKVGAALSFTPCTDFSAA